MENFNYHKYTRQMRLPNFGLVEQKKLFEAKVLVVGAGGLGCPALIYLASAGVGKFGIADFDVVEESNLHRQILYTAQDIGKLKAEQAAKKIQEINAQCLVQTYTHAIDETNVNSILKEYDIIIDGTDNFATRYLLNDACVKHHKPLVYGSISRYEGQVSVFNLKMNEGFSKNYRDLFPNEPQGLHIQNCAEAGVIGVLAGVIGCLQANEAIKIICGIGNPLANKMLSYHSLFNTFYESDYSSLESVKSLGVVQNMNMDKTEEQNTLENLRLELNKLDSSIIEILAKRKEIVTKIAKVKKTLNMALVQTEQWELTLRKRLVEASEFGLDRDFITEIFNIIHGESIAIQNRFYDNI
jgi:molybdopterin/thiamine biosynthesis adenylyltransferase/chorismate mutase